MSISKFVHSVDRSSVSLRIVQEWKQACILSLGTRLEVCKLAAV